ncbi:sensor domain-containing diguanylate cyclase [Sphaerochaeta sp. PS]|uniref:sensor domain-containing diguanylate cyclase n=1 Tax=Sphaerochaeta sp. PS TaxID=3076336 RepID=UPI0028A47328|nr:sensor domain-containing diguanylate cyclase [Sphaerochaeta sp. PS]MDT4762428.1 sensor domain-containing diguanylate cyclase [Sphaerochaeta sp. PS]
MIHEQKPLINFENLVSSLVDGVYFADPQGVFIYANQGLSDLLGYSGPEALVGRSMFDFIEDEYVDAIRKYHRPGILEISGQIGVEVKLLRSDGLSVWAEVRPTIKIPKTCPRGSFGVVRDITEYKRLEERLQNLAITDDLTGLYNRRGFKLMAEQELKHALRLNAETILLSIDVDNFKNINDTFGHDEGDKVLKLVASTLTLSFRSTDIISRWGGDEFVVLALDAPLGYVPLLSDRFQQNLSRDSLKSLLPYPLSVTIGMETTEILGDVSLNRLIMGADQNMYRQKKLKRNS